MNHSYGAVLFNDAGEVLLCRPAAGPDRNIWTFPERQQGQYLTPEETALEAAMEQVGYAGRILGTVRGTFTNTAGTDYTEFFFMLPGGERQPFDPNLTSDVSWLSPEEASARIEQTSEPRRQRDLDVLAAAVAEYQARLARLW